MKNTFDSLSVAKDQAFQLIDIFDISGKKTIYLEAHSALTYLVVATQADVHIDVVTTWPYCSCKVFWLFASHAQHPVSGSLTVWLNHPHTSAQVELFSFLHDGASVDIDGSIDIPAGLDNVSGHLLEHAIVLWKPISLKTLPKLTIASYNVTASHGANVDGLDPQKLFYMMSRGLTKEQSQKLLVDGHITSVLSNFENVSDEDIDSIYTQLV